MINEYEGTFGSVLRALRIASGYSQESLARLSGVSPREINYLETGQVRRPRRATVDALASALNADADLRQRLDHHARAAAQPPPPGLVPCQLPPVAAHTVGLERHLAVAARAAADGGTVAVCGMPGVGKTTFAVRLATALRASFPDGQIFADLHGSDEHPASPEQVLGYMLRGLMPDGGQVPPGIDERCALLRSILAGRRVLLVLDNARDEAQLRPLLPGSPGCAAIVTSRNILGGLDVRHRLHLDVLTAADATRLFGLIAGDARISAEPGRTREVIEACGGLPLALRIVATRLATRPGLSMAQLAGRLADQHGRIDELAVGDTAVDSVFSVSYRMLGSRERRLFLRLGLNPVPDFSVAAAAVLADLPEHEAAKLLEALTDVNLLELSGCGNRYRMHDLLRLYARNLAVTTDPEAQQAVDRLSAWYIATLSAAMRLITPGFAVLSAGTAGEVSPAFGNARQAAAWLESERPGIVAAALRSARLGPYAPAWLLADALRGYFFTTRDTEDWLTTARAGLAAARCAGDRSAVAAMLISLGQARASRCQYGLAISHYRQAVSQATEWPLGRAAALGNLGIVCYLQGALDEARSYYQLSLEVNRRIGNRHGEAIRLGNLASVYQFTDAFGEASRHYTESLTIYRELGNRHGEALASCNYANTCREMGRPDEAMALIEAALCIAGQLRSKLVEAVAQYGRAATCLDLGRKQDAREAALRAILCSQSIGDEVIEINSLNVFGDVERSRGDNANAAVHHADARAKARRVGYRLGEIEALVGLAGTARADGRLAEAREHAQQAVRIAAAIRYRLAERKARACLRELEA